MTIFLAIIVGVFFGFVLDRVDASNPDRLINMLRLRDFHLMKVILFAIGFSSLILFILLALDVIPPSHIKIKTAYIGVVIGGMIFGVGYAISGYCPGTCIVGASVGRKDAMFFILGGLLGAFVFSVLFGYIDKTFLYDKIAGGKVTLSNTDIEKYPALIKGVSSVIVSGAIAIFFMVSAYMLPLKKQQVN